MKLSMGAIAIACVGLAAGGQETAHAEPAADILKASGFRGGLAIVLGCDDPTMLVGLRTNDTCVVQGLDTDPAQVARARKAIQASGLYGPVSVDLLQGSRLPYVDNLANLVVVSGGGLGVGDEEITRVLAPRGVALKLHSQARARSAAPQPADDRTTNAVSVKPVPAGIDDWTHWLHGPDNNAVSHDRTVGISRDLQWIMPPVWGRHHNLLHSISAMVSANGRIFVILDEAPIAVRGPVDKWTLLCRDAFNGLDLWQRPIEDWGWRRWSQAEIGIVMRFKGPDELLERLVAAGDVLYVTLGFDAPVSALDARTGATLRTYAGTERTATLLYRDGTLYLTRNAAGDEPGIGIMAVDAQTGKRLWEHAGFKGISPHGDELQRFRDAQLTLGEPNAFFLDGDDVVALDLHTGEQVWRSPRPAFEHGIFGHYSFNHANFCTLVYHQGVVYLGQLHPDARNLNVWQEKDMDIRAYDATTGTTRWQRTAMSLAHFTPPDLFVSHDRVWTLEKGNVSLVGLDALTGEPRERFPVGGMLVGHHHRCYRDKATETYYLGGEEGIEYVDLTSGKLNVLHWLRGACAYGIMPANGMLYVPPSACGCSANVRVDGFFALSTRAAAPIVADDSGGRIEKGPAYAAAASLKTQPLETDWPTYRHDNRRSGSTDDDVPNVLTQVWSVALGGRLTAPIVADGKVVVAAEERHEIVCLAADSGHALWRFTADGRIDSPPTFARGRLFFGTHAGSIYALKADDGALIWRFQAAPAHLNLTAFGQLESVWPLNGSVFVQNGKAYCVAGRSMNLDGGLYAYALDIDTGAAVQKTTLTADIDKAGEMGGAMLPDILVGDEHAIFMRKMRFDPDNIAKRKVDFKSGRGPLYANAGSLLDTTWFNSAFWQFGNVAAQMLVFDQRDAFGIAAYRTQQSPAAGHDVFTIGDGYKLFAVHLDSGAGPSAAEAQPEANEEKAARQATARQGPPRAWQTKVPIRADAIALAGNALCIAGAPDVANKAAPWAAFENREGGVMRIVSRENGATLAEYTLDSAPAYDGMAVAEGRLFLSQQDGGMVCFGKGKERPN